MSNRSPPIADESIRLIRQYNASTMGLMLRRMVWFLAAVIAAAAFTAILHAQGFGGFGGFFGGFMRQNDPPPTEFGGEPPGAFRRDRMGA
jgi:hypothetical protein